jgi:NhaP-type Na+/H+ or K+/H+ antiporter
MLGVLAVRPGDPVVSRVVELALVAVLFHEGMRVGLRDLAGAWRILGRALALGLPLTFLATAALARLVVGLPWVECLLLGAVLSPTDPVFAAALMQRDAVPERLRGLLSVESGLNDGLALPLVLAMLAVAGERGFAAGVVLGEVALGVALGVGIAWAAVRLERSALFGAAPLYEPLSGFAIGLLVFAVAGLTHANEFVAAFLAGATVATVGPEARASFDRLGAVLGEVLKLAALFVFGALVSPAFLAAMPAAAYVFACLALVGVRPVVFGLVLAGSPLTGRERAAAAWFGPRGFASVFFGLLVLKSGVPHADEVFHLAAVVITGSIVAHASTDVLVARWFERREAAQAQ